MVIAHRHGFVNRKNKQETLIGRSVSIFFCSFYYLLKKTRSLRSIYLSHFKLPDYWTLAYKKLELFRV